MFANKNALWYWFGRRFWESRQFYSAYIALFISVTNWITIQYKLVVENIPYLNILTNILVFTVVALVLFTFASVLGGHYIHRKRQFRIEQAMALEENPYLYRAAPGKEKDLLFPVIMLQLESLQELLKSNNALTEEKKKLFQKYQESLVKLVQGQSLGSKEPKV